MSGQSNSLEPDHGPLATDIFHNILNRAEQVTWKPDPLSHLLINQATVKFCLALKQVLRKI